MTRAISPFEGMDIRSLIDARAKSRGDHPFLIWEPPEGETRTWTYSAFVLALRRFAAGLQARGVAAGDRIVVHLDNCPEGMLAWLGCAYAGAVPVTTNTKSTVAELAYFAEHSGAVGAITQPQFVDRVAAATHKLRWHVTTDTDCGAAPAKFSVEFEKFAAIDGDPSTLIERRNDPWASFGIQYTSGTTARPKAVLWTHANALWGARVCAAHEDLRADDRHLVHLPLFHTNAQVYSVLASLWVGATIILVPRFSASRFWPISLKHGATWTSLVPFCVKALMQHPLPKSHRYRFWGNGICEPESDPYFGVKTIGWWGMTETIAHGIVGSPYLRDAPMSMGRPSIAYGIHVLDEHDMPVKPGGVGDLFVSGQRGVSLFLEYADDSAATANSFRDDGLFITGDRAYVGEDGYLYFADRSKDMLKVGGENVSAAEIERVISGVEGVREVAVVAMPHPMLDEAPAAFVIAQPEQQQHILAERITRTCETVLAPFKCPRLIEFVDELPRATLEKVAKAELRLRLRNRVV